MSHRLDALPDDHVRGGESPRRPAQLPVEAAVDRPPGRRDGGGRHHRPPRCCRRRRRRAATVAAVALSIGDTPDLRVALLRPEPPSGNAQVTPADELWAGRMGEGTERERRAELEAEAPWRGEKTRTDTARTKKGGNNRVDGGTA